MNILDLTPGDIVREIKTGRERVVQSFNANMGLIEFDDSNLVGWTDAQGWIPTGERAAEAS